MSDTKDTSNDQDSPLVLELPIKYHGAEDVVGIFADQAMAFHQAGYFTLLFFQTTLPPTEDKEVLKQLQQLPARCVARIVLTPELMQKLSDAMLKNLAKYRKLVTYLAEQAKQESTK